LIFSPSYQAGFGLAQLAANHLVACPRVAGDIDAPDIHTAARIDKYGERDLALFLVELRRRIDVGEGIAFVAQALADGLGRLGHALAGEHFARLDLDQLRQFLFGHQQLPGQLDRGNRVLLALGDVDGDVDVLLVRRDRHLRRFDIEFEIAAIQVKGAQLFQVAGKLLLGILVVLGVPGQPARRAQHHQIEQVGLAIALAADDVDLAYLGDVAFGHGEIHADAIALQRRNGRRHLNRIVSLRKILPLQFLLGALDQGTIENARLGQGRLRAMISSGLPA
jgi:hypothetical protein